MQKVYPFLFIFMLLACGGQNSSNTQNDVMTISLEDNDGDNRPDLWVANQLINHSMGYDDELFFIEKTEPTPNSEDVFYTLYKELNGEQRYKGRRIQVSATVKGTDEGTPVLWLRVDGVGRNNVLALSNTILTPIIGTTEWVTQSVVVDVPEDKAISNIFYGIGYMGEGKGWYKDVKVAVVDESVPSFDAYIIPDTTNWGFEEEKIGWQMGTSIPAVHTITVSEEAYQGEKSLLFSSDQANDRQSASIYQAIDSTPYRSQQIQLTGYIKGGGDIVVSLASDTTTKTEEFSVRDNENWQEFTVDINVPSNARYLAVTIQQLGPGNVWLDEISIDIVGEVSQTEEQLQVWDEVWTAVSENYVYPDYNGLDWDAIQVEYASQIEAGLTDEAFWQGIADLFEQFGDEHTSFSTPEQAEIGDNLQSGEVAFGGVGMLTTFIEEEQADFILYVFPDSPAEEAGLKVRDRLTAVNGTPLTSEKETAQAIRGEIGTEVTLTILSPEQEAREVTLTRQAIAGNYIVTSQRLNNIGLLHIPTFYSEGIGEKVVTEWQTLNEEGELDGLIIDLRGNLGGSLAEMQTVLNLFAEGEVGQYQGQTTSKPIIATGQTIANSQNIPIVILTSEYTNSAAEMLTSMLHEAGRATIIGEPTTGNTETIQFYTFSDGSRASIADSLFLPPSQTNWDGVGIQPDILSTPYSQQGITDEGVNEALQYLENGS